MFLIDSSTSVGDNNFKTVLNSIKTFVNKAGIDSGNIRIGMATYSSNVHVQFYLNSYSSRADLLNAIDKIVFISGDKNTADGIRTVRNELFSLTHGDRPGVPNIAFVITDGVSNVNRLESIPEAEMSRDVGIELFAIGIGVTVIDELNGIGGSKNNRFLVKGFEDLEGALTSIQDYICSGKHSFFFVFKNVNLFHYIVK